MPLWSRGASQLCALLKPAVVSQGCGRAAATAPAEAISQAAAAMPHLLCTASWGPNSFNYNRYKFGLEVAKAAHARQQLVRRCPMQLFRLKGVTFDDRQEVIQNLKPGDSLMFCQEPSNPADPGAVHVRTIHLEASVGYIPQHLTDAFQLPVCFGTVVSAGVAKDTDKWGVSVACCPSLRGIVLEVFPTDHQEHTDMQQVFGERAWQQLQQQALSRYQHRCAVTSVPASELQEPLRVVPQWRIDYNNKTVQLAELIPVCQTVERLQRLSPRRFFSDDDVLMESSEEVIRAEELWRAVMGGYPPKHYMELAYCLDHVMEKGDGEWRIVEDPWQMVPAAVDKWLAGLAEE